MARAGDVETWFGAGATTGVTVGDSASTILSQVEFDARAATSDVFFRLDLDLHLAPIAFSDPGAAELPPAWPLPPEWAMVQFGRGTYHLRAGVTNPNFGLQEWDERSNYFATYSIGWGLQNGQNLGIEPGVVFDSGAEVFAFGGYDLAWMTPVTEGAVHDSDAGVRPVNLLGDDHLLPFVKNVGESPQVFDIRVFLEERMAGLGVAGPELHRGLVLSNPVLSRSSSVGMTVSSRVVACDALVSKEFKAASTVSIATVTSKRACSVAAISVSLARSLRASARARLMKASQCRP
jgi:hypothetical protein